MVIRGLNRMQKEKEAESETPAEPSAEEKVLTEIRDLLKARA
ncbi:MAG: large conductance mechanosensitive channel [Gammaproteobacteria bacterium]|jgi:large conductance mechanosensitive channel